MEKEATGLTEESILRRNKALESFFKNVLPNKVIRIIGDKGNPAVVMDFEFVLSCHVVNFNLNFQMENKGETIFTVNLDKTILSYNESQISSWISDAKHKKIYRIAIDLEKEQGKMQPPTLYLSGWNFRNKLEKEGKYPVFSEYEPKVYFKLETAEQILGELEAESYSVKII